MTLAVLAAALLAAAPKSPAPRADAPKAKGLAAHAANVQPGCGACHTTRGWGSVSFNHQKTGFPLRGAHATASCKACHLASFEAALPTTCRGCHQDPHGGELGARCEGCHREDGWASSFSVEAHRRTNFPLLGAHAQLPCEECHPSASSRRFSRATVGCADCHLPDYERTRLLLVDHPTLGFSTDCQQCHQAASFSPALFPQHDTCFELSRGPHTGIACTLCHATPPRGQVTGACNSGTATCTGCHACAEMDSTHREKAVPAYQCQERRCYECHQPLGGRP